MSSISGSSAWPLAVSEYSTRGGTSAKVWRSTMPSSSSARRRSERVRGLMPASERSSSQKREQPSASSRTSSSVHLPQTMSAVRQTGQLASTGTTPTLPTEVALTSGVARAGVPVARPRGEHEQQPRVAPSAHLVALAGGEDREEPRPAGHAVAAPARDLDLAVDDHEVGALVDLMVLELLAGRQMQRDGARLPADGVQDDRAVRLDVDAAQIPVLHASDATAPCPPGCGATRRPRGRPSSCRACLR